MRDGPEDEQPFPEGADTPQVAAHDERDLPGLHGEDRLPWLDSGDEDFDDEGVDNRRVWGFVLAGLALLTLIVGCVFWVTHRAGQSTQLADGSTIPAPPGPIKSAPANPGGKTFEGTGDSSFSVSQGKSPGARLATGGADGATPAAPPAPASPSARPASVTAAARGVAVQVGAYTSEASAEAGWAHLAKAYDTLSGVSHRVVEGSADIGTVYRLQAITASDDAAQALCDRLKSAGANCQVKD